MIRPLVAALTGVTLLGGALVAGTAPANAAGCHYRIVWNVAGVYAAPHQEDRWLIKTKQRGDIVGENCGYTISDGYEWNVVDLGGSSNVGYMRADSMRRI